MKSKSFLRLHPIWTVYFFLSIQISAAASPAVRFIGDSKMLAESMRVDGTKQKVEQNLQSCGNLENKKAAPNQYYFIVTQRYAYCIFSQSRTKPDGSKFVFVVAPFKKVVQNPQIGITPKSAADVLVFYPPGYKSNKTTVKPGKVGVQVIKKSDFEWIKID